MIVKKYLKSSYFGLAKLVKDELDHLQEESSKLPSILGMISVSQPNDNEPIYENMDE